MWHYVRDEEPVGPISRDVLKALLRKRQLEPDTPVWTEGFEVWKPAHTVEELREAFDTPPPLPLKKRGAHPHLPPPPETEAPISVESLWRDANTAPAAPKVKAARPALRWFLKTARESSAEFRIFLVCALVAIVTTGRSYLRDATADPLSILLFGVACVVLGGLLFRLRTFSEGLGWSLLCLLPRLALIAYGLNHGHVFTPVQWAALGVSIGVIDLIFLLLFWPKMWRAFVFHAGGWAIIGAYLIVWPMPEMVELWRLIER